MPWFVWVFLALAGIGALRGFCNGLKREISALIGSLVAFVLTPLILFSLMGLVYRTLENGSWDFGNPIVVLGIILAGVLIIALIPFSVFIFQYVSHLIEFSLLGAMGGQSASPWGRIPGALLGGIRFVIYGAAAAALIGFIMMAW